MDTGSVFGSRPAVLPSCYGPVFSFVQPLINALTSQEAGGLVHEEAGWSAPGRDGLARCRTAARSFQEQLAVGTALACARAVSRAPLRCCQGSSALIFFSCHPHAMAGWEPAPARDEQRSQRSSSSPQHRDRRCSAVLPAVCTTRTWQPRTWGIPTKKLLSLPSSGPHSFSLLSAGVSPSQPAAAQGGKPSDCVWAGALAAKHKANPGKPTELRGLQLCSRFLLV